jgi:RNA polymerase sigma factor (sigma-70 family)
VKTVGTHIKPNLTSFKSSTIIELSENEAVRLAQEGESKGFERLYPLHCQRVYRLCQHMVKDPIEAEDLTQDAFLQTFRKIQTFRGDSLFSTWLNRLTVNIVLVVIRKRKHFEIQPHKTFESDEESRKPFVEFSVPDLNLNGVKHSCGEIEFQNGGGRVRGAAGACSARRHLRAELSVVLPGSR